MNAPAIVSLTTDFGDRSSYVGSLRGSLLSASRRLVLADITHHVTPYDVMEAAILLRQAAPAFPQGTVHLAVVDPGVGGKRRALAVSSGGFLFVGPDNGIFTPFLRGETPVWSLDPSRVTQGPVSRTFHGRDVFAPAAARLALGESPGAMGDRITDPVLLEWPEPLPVGDRIEGVVLWVDPFGNLITNIPESLLAGGTPREVRVGHTAVERFAGTYDETEPGSLLALVGSSGLLEVAVNRGNAAAGFGAGRGARVVVQLS